jgi:branched-chain amino acid transport system ATP-binding protein
LAAASEPLLEVREIHVRYGRVAVIHGLSLRIEAGEVVAVLGPNGAGKTTLVRTLTGLVRAAAGDVRFGGSDITSSETERIVEAGCSLVPEGRQVFATLTVRENLLLGAYSLPRKQRLEGRRFRSLVAEKIGTVHRLFPRLLEREEQFAGTLSGGEQQMLAVGRALMAGPRLLVLDEPSMGLAPVVVQSIFRVIRSLGDAGMTVLLIEQNARAALRIADRGYVIETGQVLLEGTAPELLANSDVQRAYLGKEYRSIGETE